MASPSSSLVPSHHRQINYDVFVSFRGADVRGGFLSHLINTFQYNGIDAYVDYRIDRGEEISLALLDAIEKSQISLIIFSKNYASSTWCLKELVKIIECRDRNNQIVIPVFYHIEPSHVRNQAGDYGIPFAKYEKRRDITTVTKWKIASKEAAKISGLRLSDFKNEVKFIKKIVKCVSERLESLDNEVYDRNFKKLVEIQKQVADLELLLCNGSEDVCIIGIWGMGGIGKATATANVLFSNLYPRYRGCCFKANVREELEQHKLADLKMKLFSELLKDKNLKFAMTSEESYHLIRRLRRKKALILLDDVVDPEDLKLLINEGKDFGLGSIIIMTSRDKQIFNHVAIDYIYEVKALDEDEALKLFSLNVEPKEWESPLERLKNMPCEGIQKMKKLWDGILVCLFVFFGFLSRLIANILLKFKVLTNVGESDIVTRELYASDFFSFTATSMIEEYINSKLKPESWESTNETEEGISDRKKQQTLTLPPIQKTFLPIPTGIPVEGTSGLKQLLGSSDRKKQQTVTLPPIQKTLLPIPTGIPVEGTSGLKELLKF